MKLTESRLRHLVRECLLHEQTFRVYHGSDVRFSRFDPDKTTEFGIHFSLSPDSALHRSPKNVYTVNLDIENPIRMPDLIRWDLQSIMRQLGFSKEDIREKMIDASRTARTTGESRRVAENRVARKVLEAQGYDAITYDNRGEAGGEAIIVWDPSKIRIVSIK